MEKLKWGIVSSGKICHDFVNALNDPSGPAAADNTVSCFCIIFTKGWEAGHV